MWERTWIQQRLRWHLHDMTPPSRSRRALDRFSRLERIDGHFPRPTSTSLPSPWSASNIAAGSHAGSMIWKRERCAGYPALPRANRHARLRSCHDGQAGWQDRWHRTLLLRRQTRYARGSRSFGSLVRKQTGSPPQPRGLRQLNTALHGIAVTLCRTPRTSEASCQDDERGQRQV